MRSSASALENWTSSKPSSERHARAGTGALAYSGRVSEIPLEDLPRDATDAAHDAARGQVVYLTEHGERLAAIVPSELAAELENLTPEQFRELLEDFADGQAARESLAEVEAARSRYRLSRSGRNSASGRDVWPRPEEPGGRGGPARPRPSPNEPTVGPGCIRAPCAAANGRGAGPGDRQPVRVIGGESARAQVDDHQPSGAVIRCRSCSASIAARWARIGCRTGEPGNASARLTSRSRRAR